MGALTFRRAVVGAALLLTMFFLFRHTHPADIVVDQTAAIMEAAKASAPPTDENGAPAPPPQREAAPPKQKVIDTTGMSLADALQYTFPYDVETKFPAYIWQTWKYTPASGEFEDNYRVAEATWSELHPGFVHEVITDTVALHLIRYLYAGIPDVVKAYEAMPLPVLKADFFRYLILLARGGIYTDIDTHALRSALDWIPGQVPHEQVGMVIGIEADPDREDWADWYSRRIQFCQWTIQAKAGHPVLRRVVETLTKETLKRQKAGTLKNFKHEDVVDFTGPAVWTDAIFDFFNDPRYFKVEESGSKITWKEFTGMENPKKVGDVVVLPITSFSPGQATMGSKDYDDPMAFVKHDFDGKVALVIQLTGRTNIT
jgi:alpha 1,6-mannosyltransferase